jgi:hypothetical protein
VYEPEFSGGFDQDAVLVDEDQVDPDVESELLDHYTSRA